MGISPVIIFSLHSGILSLYPKSGMNDLKWKRYAENSRYVPYSSMFPNRSWRTKSCWEWVLGTLPYRKFILLYKWFVADLFSVISMWMMQLRSFVDQRKRLLSRSSVHCSSLSPKRTRHLMDFSTWHGKHDLHKKALNRFHGTVQLSSNQRAGEPPWEGTGHTQTSASVDREIPEVGWISLPSFGWGLADPLPGGGSSFWWALRSWKAWRSTAADHGTTDREDSAIWGFCSDGVYLICSGIMKKRRWTVVSSRMLNRRLLYHHRHVT
jgi:hypothetical protein